MNYKKILLALLLAPAFYSEFNNAGSCSNDKCSSDKKECTKRKKHKKNKKNKSSSSSCKSCK